LYTKKNNNSFILVYFCQRSQAKLFLQNLQKTTQEQSKGSDWERQGPWAV
jgi:hypothetical protein